MIVVLLAALGGTVAWMWGGKGADEASVEDALERFRQARQQGDGHPLEPAPGVYLYRGRGTEKLSVLAASQEWGPRIPATVTATGPSCWSIRFEYSSNHRQAIDYCVRGTELQETGGTTEQRFDFGAFAADDTNEFTCDPPGVAIRLAAAPGDHWRQECHGRSRERGTEVTSAGTNTYVGTRRLTIEGQQVEALAYRVERTLSGDQTGTEHNELWFDVDTGRPLRYRRDTRVGSPSPLGTVTYREQGLLTATTLTPRR